MCPVGLLGRYPPARLEGERESPKIMRSMPLTECVSDRVLGCWNKHVERDELQRVARALSHEDLGESLRQGLLSPNHLALNDLLDLLYLRLLRKSTLRTLTVWRKLACHNLASLKEGNSKPVGVLSLSGVTLR
jgi:hypothetical protein